MKQKLKFMNGYRMVRDTHNLDDVSCSEKFFEYDPTLTYYRPERPASWHERQRFLPHYVLYQSRCLKLKAYFRQGIFGSADEYFRVRPVNIVYYLEDDTMGIVEPPVHNSGFKQGRLVKRSKIPKPGFPGEVYHWKDLNVGIDFEVYGVVYRVYDCDAYTREFLRSQGIDVGEPESCPLDPYTQSRTLKKRLEVQPCKQAGGPDAHSTRLADRKLYMFLEYDGMILTFDALWEGREYKLQYYLGDDTVAVSLVRKRGDPVEGKSLMLRRTKLPKNWKQIPPAFPSCYLETTDREVYEYYSPSDLKVGETVFVFGRRFLLYDCDPFTRKYYSQMLGMDQPPRIDPTPYSDCPRPMPPPQPLQPDVTDKPRHRDVLRQLYHFPDRLRYSLSMEAVHPEDEDRQFVLEYSLGDGCCRISELEKANSGRRAGRFLGWQRLPKPKTSGDEDDGVPKCYSPQDFAVGARLNIFGHWFVVEGTELHVLNYARSNPDKFSPELVKNIEDHLRQKGLLKDCEEGQSGIKEDKKDEKDMNREGCSRGLEDERECS
ncbi:hypothetical protein QAD02_019723 [Eretmocerus hayati]|uniref:Uncharacterized protein n=1 Tax=Eretmocerus hayati TaxID=131215 RepID=A0ACC2PKE7_9HYME|nr:hypothetical protein QAD02_019723 [Eretmocerus hayati]